MRKPCDGWAICHGPFHGRWEKSITQLHGPPSARAYSNVVTFYYSTILRCLYWALVPEGLALMFAGELFYCDSPRDTLAERVAYAAIAKPLFATLMAMLIAGTIFKIDNLYRKALEWDKWTIPIRLSYCVFVIHHVIIQVLISLRHSLVVLSCINVVIFVLAVTLVSFITAVPLWLLVETPFTGLIKYYSSRSQQKKLN